MYSGVYHEKYVSLNRHMIVESPVIAECALAAAYETRLVLTLILTHIRVLGMHTLPSIVLPPPIRLRRVKTTHPLLGLLPASRSTPCGTLGRKSERLIPQGGYPTQSGESTRHTHY